MKYRATQANISAAIPSGFCAVLSRVARRIFGLAMAAGESVAGG